MNNARRILSAGTLGVLFTFGGVGGCVERRVEVTSDPSGARVWLNDELIGVTPCEAGFTYYGKYDVRLALEGYEPIHEGREMKAPIYEYPIVDLAATAVPIDFESVNRWHFVLTATDEIAGDRDALIDRAAELRDR